MATFSGTSIAPVVRVGNSADAVQALRRDTSIAWSPANIVRPVIIRAVIPTEPALEFAPKRRVLKRRRAR